MDNPGEQQEAKSYKIGELAEMFGLTVRTIRYYDELGLLRPSTREEGEQRRYPEQNLVYLKRILQLKSYGLSLGEIKEFFVLAAEDRSGETCRQKLIAMYAERLAEAEKDRAAAEKRMAELDWHIRQLRSGGNFFECPGRRCATCAFENSCDMRVGQTAMEGTK